jgi:hypothetical protein
MTICWLTVESLVTKREGLVLVLDRKGERQLNIPGCRYIHCSSSPPHSSIMGLILVKLNNSMTKMIWKPTGHLKKSMSWSVWSLLYSNENKQKKHKINDYLLIDCWIPCHNKSGLGLGRRGTGRGRQLNIPGCRDIHYSSSHPPQSVCWLDFVTPQPTHNFPKPSLVLTSSRVLHTLALKEKKPPLFFVDLMLPEHKR